MFRIWAKLFKDNRLIHDYTVSQSDYSLSRTDMVLHSLEKACYELDLAKPIWLSSNIEDFKKHSKTRFYADSFLETIGFDYLEIEVIEE